MASDGFVFCGVKLCEADQAIGVGIDVIEVPTQVFDVPEFGVFGELFPVEALIAVYILGFKVGTHLLWVCPVVAMVVGAAEGQNQGGQAGNGKGHLGGGGQFSGFGAGLGVGGRGVVGRGIGGLIHDNFSLKKARPPSLGAAGEVLQDHSITTV